VNFIICNPLNDVKYNAQNGNTTCRDIYFDNCSFGKHAAHDICLHKTMLSEDV